MKFSLNKLFGSRADKSVKKDAENINSIETIIKSIENKPFAISDSNVLYLGFNELGGYHFMQTIVVGDFHIKTKKGAKLTCYGDGLELTFQSDMEELESDLSSISKRCVTPIDFQVEEDDILKIDRLKVNKLTLNVEKKTLTFNIYETEG